MSISFILSVSGYISKLHIVSVHSKYNKNVEAALAAKDSTALAVLGFFIEVSMTFIIPERNSNLKVYPCALCACAYIECVFSFNQQGTDEANKTKSWDILTSYLTNITNSSKQIDVLLNR